jgi:hypothetical protein
MKTLPRITSVKSWDQSEILTFRKIGFYPKFAMVNGIKTVRYFNENCDDRTDQVKEIFGDQFLSVNYKVLCELDLISQVGEETFAKLHSPQEKQPE